MEEGQSLGDLIGGMEVTFQHETCSSLIPYERVDAGVSLEVFGLQSSAGSPGTWFVHLGDGLEGTEANPDGIFIALTVDEFFEVTNAEQLLKLSGRWPKAGYNSFLRES